MDRPLAARMDRPALYWRYLIERGGLNRYGTPFWQTKERLARIETELAVIEKQGYSSTFVMLADVMNYCRRERISVGPGRGSVGGCYTAFLAGIHDVDSLEYDLDFERFLNEKRVSFPDVDIDVSQRHRPRVLQYIVDTYNTGDQVVLQVGAFVRAGGRAVVDLMAGALAQHDPNAWATATNLKKCFPDSSITGGQKIQRELHAWLYDNKGHGEKKQFIEIAEQAGWLETLLKLDGMFTHLGKHAAGVVILRQEDMPFIPTVEVTNAKGERATVTAYDMYALDDLGYLKWDWLGLRTLDVISDAHRFIGGSGDRDELIALWREHRDDPAPYPLLCEARDLTGVFQFDTDGYKRTLRDFQPTCFDHIVQLVALYRPGAIDYKREDGKNMVAVFIDRMHGREQVSYEHPLLRPILEKTHGVILYQEQQMKIARELAGFTLAQADLLRRAIGKKKSSEMDVLIPLFRDGCARKGIQEAVVERLIKNIEAAARYSWNKSHAVEYGIITWLTAWFAAVHPAAFYAAEINSWEDKKDRQANVISVARQHADFRAPDVNIAEDRFIVEEGEIVFGLNGIKGMGDSYRNTILCERILKGAFASFEDFCQRCPSVPINMKLALVKCGAFDRLDDRMRLLATVPKHGKDTRWTVAEHLNHNRKLKTARPLPDVSEWCFPKDTELAAGEMGAMGYYISNVPLKDVTKAMTWHDPANVIGGEIDKVLVKDDRNGNAYGNVTIITPSLQKQLVRIFASDWGRIEHRCTKGTQLLFRGRTDGGAFLANDCWTPFDVRPHKKIRVWNPAGDMEISPFDGQIATVRAYESAGYRVQLM